MKVLFVSSGNKSDGISPIVKNQGSSLIKQGQEVYFYKIKGKGIKGYLKNIKPLKERIKDIEPDVIHAHYSICGYVCSLTKTKIPIVTSLMGSDAIVKGVYKIIIKWHIKKKWFKTITKTSEMKRFLNEPKIVVIPNGVDTELFAPIKKEKAQRILNWSPENQHVLFAANPKRPEKNYSLFQESIKILNQEYNKFKITTHVLSNVPHHDIPIMMNAADIVVLTSLREGSPNVIKEAMSCSRPIIATKVGDVQENLSSTNNCKVVSFSALEIAKSLECILANDVKSTNGRGYILKHLSEEIIADKLIEIYKETQEIELNG